MTEDIFQADSGTRIRRRANAEAGRISFFLLANAGLQWLDGTEKFMLRLRLSSLFW